MGNHYVPKAYQRGFCVEGSDSLIEVFDKDQEKHYRTNIINVAQENRFYDDETEALLATKVEDPAKPAIDKLRLEQILSNEERHHLAIYAAVLLKRVPHSRQRSRELLPETVNEVVSNVRTQLEMFLSRGEGKQEVIESHLEKIEGLEDRMIEDPPEKVRQQMDSPWPTQKMVDADRDYEVARRAFGWPSVLCHHGQPRILFQRLWPRQSRIRIRPSSFLHRLIGR